MSSMAAPLGGGVSVGGPWIVVIMRTTYAFIYPYVSFSIESRAPQEKGDLRCTSISQR
jgi:hypothetical protein